MIPNKKSNTKKPFNSLKTNEHFDVGEYSVELMRKMGAHLAYYNNTRANKRFVQRTILIDNIKIIRIYRER